MAPAQAPPPTPPLPTAPLPTVPGDAELFDETPCGLLVLSTRGLILKANRTFCTWVGMTAHELVHRKKLQELLTMGGRIFHQTHWLPMMEMQGSLAEVKFDMLGPGGNTFPALLNAVRRHGEGGSYDEVSVVVARDRNQYERELLIARQRADDLLDKERAARAALRSTQARLQQAMQIGDIYIWDMDPATGTRRFGDEVALLLGFAAPRPVDEAMFLAAVADEDRNDERAALDRALQGTPYHWTYRLNGQDGVQRVVVSSAQAFMDEAGAVAEFVGTLTDITEIHRLRRAAEDRALFAEQMVGVVSHDLRSPLQTIFLSTQALARSNGLDAERNTRMLDNIERAARRAGRLTANLLDFTAARLGKGVAVQRRRVDIHAVVGAMVEELAAAHPGHTLQHHASGPGTVSADADRLAQLIGNLVGNAMAYGQADQPITITSSVDAGQVRLSVHNMGEPIPPDRQQALFEPMVRGGAVDNNNINNTARSVGLGLFIVRAIALAHGGDITVASSRDHGTEFVLRFHGEHAPPR